MSENRENLAEELWEHRNDPDEWSEEEEDIEVKPRRSSVLSFRLPSEELDALERAMEQTGESLSDYIRNALRLRMQKESIKSTIELTYGDPDYWCKLMRLGEGQRVMIEGASGDRERFNGRQGEFLGVQERLGYGDEPFALVKLDGGGNVRGRGYRLFWPHELSLASAVTKITPTAKGE